MVFNHLIGVRFPVGPPNSFMKFLRIGELNNEKPAIIEKDGTVRDISSIINDLNPETLNFDTIDKLKKIDLKTLAKFNEIKRIGSCINNPGKFIGIGLNFVDHAKEQNLPEPKEPIVFSKATSCITGPYDDIRIPINSKKTDWEVEIGFVVGRKAKNISENEAINYIFGYCLVDDISEREFQKKRGGQWIKGKSADTFGPIGPYLVTTDEIPNVQKLNMILDINNKRMQTGNTANMIFSINFILSYLSNFMTLLPGDIITTGTPPGVGDGKKPPIYLKKGDKMRLEIDFLGQQLHEVK